MGLGVTLACTRKRLPVRRADRIGYTCTVSRHSNNRAVAGKLRYYFFRLLCTTCARSTTRGRGMEEPSRDLAFSSELPPPTLIEKSRDVRQVSHVEWSLARRARTLSRCLQAQARQLRTESQALLDRQHSGAPSLAPASSASARLPV